MAGRGSYAKGRAKREEIAEVALELFTSKGYDRTSVREIARLTGLSQAGLLHYFKTKEDLFVEVLRRRDDRNEREHDENQGKPISLAGLVEVVRHNSQEPGLVRLYVTMSAESTAPESPAREFFERRYERLLAGLAESLRQQKRSGELAEDVDEEAVASLLVAAADGLQVQWLLDPDGFDMGERLELLSKILLGAPSH
jgi:AcrR family transcriptional regulator